ncbi:hypothetical protein [Bacillus sp. JCM 19034]|nr:hypothetical protein [Bacillus sp. JCM 19034]
MSDNTSGMILLIVTLFVVFSFVTGIGVREGDVTSEGPASPLLLFEQS